MRLRPSDEALASTAGDRVSASAMQEAVELATICANVAELPPHVVSAAIGGALRAHPVRALAGQAALTGAVGRIAEERVDAMLSDPVLLRAALDAALERRPWSAEALELSRGALLRRAGAAAARLL